MNENKLPVEETQIDPAGEVATGEEQAATTSENKIVASAVEVLQKKVGQSITWSESGLTFKGKVDKVAADNSFGGDDMLGIWVADIQYTPLGQENWQSWQNRDDGSPSLAFAASELSLADNDDSSVDVNGTPHGPTRVKIG